MEQAVQQPFPGQAVIQHLLGGDGAGQRGRGAPGIVQRLGIRLGVDAAFARHALDHQRGGAPAGLGAGAGGGLNPRDTP
jgi:hypothetical protein